MGLFHKKEVKGAVALFLVAIMLPMMVISALMVDTARYNLGKSMVSSAGDLAMNAALADYDTILKEVYGLFAMSQADEVEENVKKYFTDTLVSYGVVDESDAGDYMSSLLGSLYESLVIGDMDTTNFLTMSVDAGQVNVEKLNGSALSEPSILEKQIVEYMKYRAPIGFGMSFLDSLSAFTRVTEQAEVVEAQVAAQEGMETAASACSELYKATDTYDGRYNELENTGTEFHLTNYGRILKSYTDRYREVNRLTMTFCVGSYTGRWDTGTKPRQLIAGQDAFILNNGGTWSTAAKSSFTGYNNRDYSGMKAVMNDFYQSFSSGSYNLDLYGNTNKIPEVRDLSSPEQREAAITEFQKADQFYKQSYEIYSGYLDQLNYYIAAMSRYEAVANEEKNQVNNQLQGEQSTVTSKENRINELNSQINVCRANIDALCQKDGSVVTSLATLCSNVKTWEKQYRQLDAEIAGLPSQTEAEKEYKKQKEKERDQIKENARSDIEAQEQDADKWWNTISENQIQEENCLAEIDRVMQEKQEALENAEELKVRLTEVEADIAEKKRQYQEILSRYSGSVNAYNHDARAYCAYIKNAQDAVTAEVSAMASEFTLIRENIASLQSALEDIKEKYAAAKKEIQEYMNGVEEWESANEQYKADSEDNFSGSNDAEIKDANQTFNMEEVNELYNYITSELDKLIECLRQIDANFVYMGSSRLPNIRSAEDVATAIRTGNAAATVSAYQTSGEISADTCNSLFSLTDNIEVDFLDQLQQLIVPIPCCTFMNYLYQTYGVAIKEFEDSGEENQKAGEENKKTYNQIKENGNKLKETVEQNAAAVDYGYNYQNISSVGGEGWPSSLANAGQGDAVQENTSCTASGFSENKKTVSKLLDGLGDAMETGRDKLFVTEYLFENFSYNTIVQDMTREKYPDLHWPGNVEASWYEEFKNKAETSGGVKISSVNNQIYGAEIEYILYGNSNPATNVTSAKASIFAIRCLFNSVFAFTDSGIRNDARAVGLSVQAASMGLIPYQLVQVVVQLALALAESACDLQNMSVGAKVPIIKSKQTWSMSSEGMMNLAKEILTEKARSAVDKAAEAIQGKISQVIDATADNIADKVQDVSKDLTNCVNSAAGELLNQIFDQADALITNVMNQTVNSLFYSKTDALPDDLAGMQSLARSKMDSAFDQINTEFNAICQPHIQSGTDLEKAAWQQARILIGNIVENLKEEAGNIIAEATDEKELQEEVYQMVYHIKAEVSQTINDKLDDMIGAVSAKFDSKIRDVQKTLTDKTKDVTDKTAAKVKDEVVQEINGFVDGLSSQSTKMKTGALSNASNNAVDSSTKASAIKFGYSDYLKLFVFIGLCADSKSGAMLARTADLIQLNIAAAGESSDLYHRMGNQFKMSEAKTYVSIEANVELDMMFLNLGVLQKQVESWNTEHEDGTQVDLEEGLNIHYLGISGY